MPQGWALQRYLFKDLNLLEKGDRVRIGQMEQLAPIGHSF